MREYYVNLSHIITSAIDYRLAPDHVYPAALIDTLSAYAYLLNPPSGQRFKPHQICIAGDSAGGGLAIASMLYCRDSGVLPIPGAVATMSPWYHMPNCRLDLTQSLPSWILNEPYDFLPHTAKDPKYFNEHRSNLYTSHDNELCDPYVSPIFAQESARHRTSPIFIQVGEAER